MKEKLPKYDNPPVIETVLGVEFEPLHNWQIPHFGLYWERIRSNYQQFSVQPPLPEQLEKFGEQKNSFKINLSQHPNARCWFFDNKNSWLLQIQNNRFLSNWKQAQPSYPNYAGFYNRFTREWNKFKKFLEAENLELPKLLQCEVSYINHIEIDSDFGDLDKIFPVWAGFSNEGFLPKPEAIALNSVYVIPENLGRLYIELQPVLRHSDIKAVLQLTVTSKIKIMPNHNLKKSMDLAHKWVVNGFTDFTSDKIHKHWGRRG